MVLNAIGYPKPLTVSGYKSDFFGKDPKTYEWHPEYAEKFGVDDFAAGFVRLENDIVLDFRISWAMNMDTCGDALILGTKGGLRIPSTLGDQTVEYQVPLKESDPKLFYKKLRSFVDAIKNGGEATVPSSQIVINQAILDGLVKSAELGKEIEIEIPEI